jgi:hypothetical protein
LLISAKWGDRPYCENTTASSGDSSVLAVWRVASGHRDHRTLYQPTSFCGRFLKSTNIIQDEDKIKQAISNGGQQTLQNIARNKLKRAIVSLQDGVPHFHHLLKLHSLSPFWCL